MKKITIVDYGSGNVLSAQKSFVKIAKDNNIEVDVLISKKLNDVKDSTHVVLPGQGAFSTCMNGLKKTDGLIDELSEFALIKKKPFLGICVGMQMLANMSEENGVHEGLGWIDGQIKLLPGDTLIFKCSLLGPFRRGICHMQGLAYANGKLCAEAELTAQITKVK